MKPHLMPWHGWWLCGVWNPFALDLHIGKTPLAAYIAWREGDMDARFAAHVPRPRPPAKYERPKMYGSIHYSNDDLPWRH